MAVFAYADPERSPLAGELSRTDDGAALLYHEVLPLAVVSDGGSSLDPDTVISEVVDHLRSAPAAWDPYRADPDLRA